MHKKILVVDDDIVSLKIIVAMLKKRFQHVDAVDSAADAFNLLKHTKYDIIFTDIAMPIVNGIELSKQIRCCCVNNKTTLIIAITATIPQIEMETLFNGIIEKPIMLSKIQENNYWLDI